MKGVEHSLPQLARQLDYGEAASLPALELDQLSSLTSAGARSLSFLEYPQRQLGRLWRTRLAELRATKAGAVLVPESVVGELDYHGSSVLVPVADVNAAVQRALELLYPPIAVNPGVHPTAVIDASARVDPGAEIGAQVVIGAGCEIAAGCILHPGCVLGQHCSLGAGTVLYPRVVLYDHCRLGAGCILHSGVVVGADGFGFNKGDDGYWRKKRHVGGVIIGDDVEIGANSCVDQGAYQPTNIGSGVKIDNLVQIGHNVAIGERGLICAQAGVAGSAQLGADTVLAGKTGVKDNTSVPAGTVVKVGDLFLRASARGAILRSMPTKREGSRT